MRWTTLIRKTVWLASIGAVLLVGHGLAADDPKPAPATPRKNPTVMQRKLTHAQKVLEGLATEDFEKIRISAEGIRDCIKDETWRINDTEKYLTFSDNFLRQTEAMREAAKKKNIDSATLAYVGMTLSCVKCHQHLRDERGGALRVEGMEEK